MRRSILSKIFGGYTSRVVTPLNTAPAPVPDEKLEQRLNAGKTQLDHYMTHTERTVAASQELFAGMAADLLRR